jgi:hypothetical protein
MKAIVKLVTAMFVAPLLLSTACSKDDSVNNSGYAQVLEVNSEGTSTLISQHMLLAFTETPELTESELTTLLKMKEEEQLARDVYSELYQKWNNVVFSRISNAENNHHNAIIRLLQYYNSSDTLAGNPGTFENVEVQALYSTLVAQGSQSAEEALKTGALIEEMDLKDLGEALAATSNANITMVFENLERGSRNHLRAFNKQLTNLGLVYSPIYISQSDFDIIINSPMEKGKAYKMKGNGKGKANCTGNGNGKGKGMKKGKH